MYFGLSEDQIFFQDNVKKFLEDQAPLDVVKKIVEGNSSEIKDQLHQGLVNLGINNILVPEENGGLGLDLLFATAISQSLGSSIATLPFIGPYVMAPIAIKHGASGKQKNNLFEGMSNNSINFGIGFSEYFGSRDSSGITFSKNKVNPTSEAFSLFKPENKLLVNLPIDSRTSSTCSLEVKIGSATNLLIFKSFSST